GDQGAGDGLADPWDGSEQVLLVTPGRRTADGVVDGGVQSREFLLQGGEQTGDAVLEALLGQALLTLAFGEHHFDDLAAPRDELAQALRAACDREVFAGGTDRHVQPVLGDVDTDKGGVHAVPSLRKRASLAAQATVRVQWNDGRGALLSHGLAVPQGNRSPA